MFLTSHPYPNKISSEKGRDSLYLQLTKGRDGLYLQLAKGRDCLYLQTLPNRSTLDRLDHKMHIIHELSHNF